MAAKNAAQVYPCLQEFLFCILRDNREVLGLSLGKDSSCLIPRGYAPAYRSGCVFYRFQLVTPERPEMSESILRLILQNCIDAELRSHGIAGLPSGFQCAVVGIMPSVFLDRVTRIIHPLHHLNTRLGQFMRKKILTPSNPHLEKHGDQTFLHKWGMSMDSNSEIPDSVIEILARCLLRRFENFLKAQRVRKNMNAGNSRKRIHKRKSAPTQLRAEAAFLLFEVFKRKNKSEPIPD